MSQRDYTNWLPEETYQKLLGSWKRQSRALLYYLFGRLYGQATEVDIAMKGLEELTEKFGMALRGKNIPIQLPLHLQKQIEEFKPDD